MKMLPSDGSSERMAQMASAKMTQFLNLMHRFESLDWETVEDIIIAGVWDRSIKDALITNLETNRARRVPSPGLIPGLRNQLLTHVPESIHMAERIGGLGALGSIVFEPKTVLKDYSLYNPDIIISNYTEGSFGRVSGRPGKGKTNIECVRIERWMNSGRIAISNIRPKKGSKTPPRYFYESKASGLFRTVSKLHESEQWHFSLDEGGLMYGRPDQSTRRVKDLDKLVRVIRKLHGSMTLIEQRPESVPQIFVDFSTNIFYAHEIGDVSIELKGPIRHFSERLKGFPATSLPFDTYDIAFFDVDIDVVEMLEALSGKEDPKKAMLRFLKSAERR